MKTLTHGTARSGSALVIAMLVVFLIAAFVGVAMYLTTGTLRQADSSRDFSGLRSAAEGALDFAYGVWTKTVNSYYAPATQSQLNAALATVPSFNGYGYAPAAENGPLKLSPVNGYGAPIGSPAYTLVNLPGYTGWTGKNYAYLASVRLTGTTNGGRTIKYGAKRTINYSVVPLFQATAFFEDNMELYKTAPMTIGGLVHTNSTAYVSSSSTSSPTLTFTGNLSYVSGYSDDAAPPLAYLWSGYSPNSAFPPSYPNGASTSVHQVNRMEPLGADPASVLDTSDANPNNDSMRELIEPPTNTGTYPDPTPIAQRRLYNKAGIIIKASGGSYTVTTQNGAHLSGKQVTALKGALSEQTVYDRREGKWVDVTTLDVAKATVDADTGKEKGALSDKDFNNILYIYNDDSTAADPKAVRLTNGSVLPSGGLTVASLNPVYIQGDYNTGQMSDYSDRVPSAVYADAVTILSNNWQDSNSASALSSRQASNTTVNTAIVAGFLPSGWVNEYGAQYGYSGGLNNFPRFLETWSGDTFTYNGSMIELFTSKIATGEWDTGNIYSPPNRNWNYDSQFIDNPPPGSLDAVTISRGSLARF
jgi:hypothetical protein